MVGKFPSSHTNCTLISIHVTFFAGVFRLLGYYTMPTFNGVDSICRLRQRPYILGEEAELRDRKKVSVDEGHDCGKTRVASIIILATADVFAVRLSKMHSRLYVSLSQ